jgi:hypothetical protein
MVHLPTQERDKKSPIKFSVNELKNEIPKADPMSQPRTHDYRFGVQSGAIDFAWVTHASSAIFERLGSRLLRPRHALQHVRPKRWRSLWRTGLHCLQQKCNL